MSNPIDVVREFCALMEGRDPDALRPLLADDAIYQNVGMPAFIGVEAIVENMAAGYIDPYVGGGTKDFAPYVLMIIALMVRPYGIFGKAIIERI